MPTTFFFAPFVSSQIRDHRSQCLFFFFAQMTSCAVRYHLIYHSFRINFEHLKTWRVDSHVTEWRSKLELELELETCKRKMLAIQRVTCLES